MKRAFSLITAIVFLLIVSLMSVKLLISSKEQYSTIQSEYLRAEAKSITNAMAHYALMAWLRANDPNYTVCNSSSPTQNTFCGSKIADSLGKIAPGDYYDELAFDLGDAVFGGTASNAYTVSNLQDDPFNVPSVQERLCLKKNPGSFAVDRACGPGYVFQVVISRMLSVLPTTGTAGQDRLGDYMFVGDFASADFLICTSTDGGKFDSAAPAGYCQRFTFSN